MKSLELARIVHEKLKPLGYKRKGATWNITSDEVVGMLQLQKSQFGEQFYINIGLLPLAKTDGKFVTYGDCFMEINYRLENLYKDGSVPSVINFEKMGEKSGVEFILGLLDSHIIPFFLKNNSMAGIIDSYNQGILSGRYAEHYLRKNGYIK